MAAGEDAAELILTNLRALERLGPTCGDHFIWASWVRHTSAPAGPGEGLAAVEEALRFVAETGELWYEPELHRLRGELALAAGGARDKARTAFEAALKVAGERGALAFALRAAIRLARLDAEAGERQRAHALLTQVYNRLTEGFATPDLIEAKKLLAAL